MRGLPRGDGGAPTQALWKVAGAFLISSFGAARFFFSEIMNYFIRPEDLVCGPIDLYFDNSNRFLYL